MDIIARRAKEGKTTEILRRFFEDKESSLLISSEIRMEDVFNIAKYKLHKDLNDLIQDDKHIQLLDKRLNIEEIKNIASDYIDKEIKRLYLDVPIIVNKDKLITIIEDLEVELKVQIIVTYQLSSLKAR